MRECVYLDIQINRKEHNYAYKYAYIYIHSIYIHTHRHRPLVDRVEGPRKPECKVMYVVSEVSWMYVCMFCMAFHCTVIYCNVV